MWVFRRTFEAHQSDVGALLALWACEIAIAAGGLPAIGGRQR